MIGHRIDGELVQISPGQALCGVGFEKIVLELKDFEDLDAMSKARGDKAVMDWLVGELIHRMCPPGGFV